jgi:hypothetical protein
MHWHLELWEVGTVSANMPTEQRWVWVRYGKDGQPTGWVRWVE